MTLVELRSEAATAQGASLKVNGVDLTSQARACHVTVDVAHPNRVIVELAPPRLDLSLPAEVVLQVLAVPGWVVIEEPLADGRKRWRCERETAETK